MSYRFKIIFFAALVAIPFAAVQVVNGSELQVRNVSLTSSLAFSAAAEESGVIHCGKDTNGDGVVGAGEQCTWNDLIKTVANIINELISIAVILSALAFTYAGFLYITAGGDTGKVETAKGIIGKVALGLVIMLAAWALVHSIELAFFSSGVSSLLGK